MKLKNFTRKMMCCVMLAASMLTAHAADRLLIVGTGVWGGWSLSNSVVMLNSAEQPDVWKATVSLNANEGFKFLTDTDFGSFQYRAGDGDVTLASGVAATLYPSDENQNDSKFMVAEKANYDIVCDLAKKSITVTKAEYQLSELKHTVLWLIGSATPGEWSLGDGVQLTQDATNPVVFYGTAELKEGEMKVAVNKYGGYDQTFYQRNTSDDGKMVFGGDDNKWNITAPGLYDVKLNVEALTISITEHTSTAISSASLDNSATAPTEYYTLDGVKTTPCKNGVYVMKQGKRVLKVKKSF